MQYRSIVLAVAICAGSAACDKATDTAAMPQAKGERPTLCVVDDFRQDAVAAKCIAGQPIAFLPNSFGNEQLPIMFAALNCDLDKQVVQTTGGVACTYRPVTIKQDAEPAKKSTAG